MTPTCTPWIFEFGLPYASTVSVRAPLARVSAGSAANAVFPNSRRVYGMGTMVTSPAMHAQTRRSDWSWWYLLFAIEWVAVLWPPFYNKLDPEWHGIPFFYWYQLLWVVISAALTAIVYFATEVSRR